MVASLFFYVWGEGAYVAVLLVSIGLNYVFGLLLERVERPLASRAVAGRGGRRPTWR